LAPLLPGLLVMGGVGVGQSQRSRKTESPQ
jgi:hypothetical protein